MEWEGAQERREPGDLPKVTVKTQDFRDKGHEAMKQNYLYTLIFTLLQITFSVAQQDSITRLDEVLLSDVKLYQHSSGQQVRVLTDSVIKRNESSLASLLKFNSPVYLRENGYGMVASASFRGTTASQTAVVWNGININSQFNGQTDFNTINTSGFSDIAVKAGGGSVIYGSGAIGGSIHLNNRFQFEQDFENSLQLNYGSFNTFSGSYNASASSEKTSVYIGLSGVNSDNDYSYPQEGRHNENGDFYNISFNAGIAHWLGKKDLLKFYSNAYSGLRGFSGTLSAPSNSKYENRDLRNLLEWKAFYRHFTSSLKLGYLDEHYKYFENRNSDQFDHGRAKTAIGKYDLSFRPTKTMSFDILMDYRHTKGEGSDIGEKTRNQGALALLFKQDLQKLSYELSARKEFSDRYESPLLFSLGGNYSLTSWYDLKLNFSRNYRTPTYNDLFWSGSGSQDLKPETSWQAELGNHFQFGKLKTGATLYAIKIEDLLRWVPDSNGIWRPENTENVTNYGVEVEANWEKQLGDHQFELTSIYTYTRTLDEETRKELIYTPKHKLSSSIGYHFRRFSAFYQFLYTGSIYTSSDNAYKLPGYSLSNLGMEMALGKYKNMILTLQLRNLFDKDYQNMPARPMPGFSINTSLSLKF